MFSGFRPKNLVNLCHLLFTPCFMLVKSKLRSEVQKGLVTTSFLLCSGSSLFLSFL
jgi:hypothetical protein